VSGPSARVRLVRRVRQRFDLVRVAGVQVVQACDSSSKVLRARDELFRATVRSYCKAAKSERSDVLAGRPAAPTAPGRAPRCEAPSTKFDRVAMWLLRQNAPGAPEGARSRAEMDHRTLIQTNSHPYRDGKTPRETAKADSRNRTNRLAAVRVVRAARIGAVARPGAARAAAPPPAPINAGPARLACGPFSGSDRRGGARAPMELPKVPRRRRACCRPIWRGDGESFCEIDSRPFHRSARRRPAPTRSHLTFTMHRINDGSVAGQRRAWTGPRGVTQTSDRETRTPAPGLTEVFPHRVCHADPRSIHNAWRGDLPLGHGPDYWHGPHIHDSPIRGAVFADQHGRRRAQCPTQHGTGAFRPIHSTAVRRRWRFVEPPGGGLRVTVTRIYRTHRADAAPDPRTPLSSTGKASQMNWFKFFRTCVTHASAPPTRPDRARQALTWKTLEGARGPAGAPRR